MKENKGFWLTSARTLRICVILLAVSVLFGVSSAAWLSRNRTVEQQNPKMNLAYDDTEASYDVYRYDIKQGAGKNVDDAGNPLTIASVDMNPYDLIFTSRNRYTPVFARIKLMRHSAMPKNGTIHLTISRTDHDDKTGSTLSSYSSSLVRFSANISDIYDDDPAKLYTKIDAAMYTATKSYVTELNATSTPTYDSFSKSFVTATKSGDTYTFTKADSITLLVPYTQNQWSTDADGVEILNIYLYITYDEGLVELYKETSQMGKIDVGAKNIVDFANDFDMIKVSYEGVTSK